MKKKICFIVSTPYTAKAFLEAHFEVFSGFYDVYLVGNLDDSEIKDYANVHLIEIKHIPIHRKINIVQDIKALFLLTKYLKKNKFDAINTFTPKAGLIGITSGTLAGIKNRVHFFTGQVWHTKAGFFKRFLILLDKIVVALSTKVLVDGKPQQEFLVQNNIITSSNSKVLGRGTISGIDHDKFCPKPEIRQGLRASLNYKDDDIVFLFLGRLNIDKGILDLAQAFKRLLISYPSAKLLLVGPDEENIIPKLNEVLGANYHFYGSTNTPQELMQVGDVFCLPSHREAFGLSVIEASACGLPILCSDTYGLRDTIIDGETGLRHSTHNVNSIFDNMKILIQSKDLRMFLGNNGIAYTRTYFSKQNMSKLWLEYFNQLLSK